MTDEYIKPRENGRNIVGCYMLRPFAHIVACCCLLLEVLAHAKFKNNQTFSCAQKDERKSNREGTMEGRGERQLSYCGSQRKDHCKLKLSTFPRISYWYDFRSGHHHWCCRKHRNCFFQLKSKVTLKFLSLKGPQLVLLIENASKFLVHRQVNSIVKIPLQCCRYGKKGRLT